MVYVLLVVLCAGCTDSTHQGSASRDGAGDANGVITVGSFNFPESVLLAYLYADALAARGFPTRVLPNLGNRELVEPALMRGMVQLVPEYNGSALEFLSLHHAAAPTAVATQRSLGRWARQRGLVAARPASAQDANAIVVTAATARRHHLRSIGDLAELAPDMVFGGPPECLKRTDCLPGLRRVYGLRFKSFTPTDAGGPLTRQALVSGQIGAGLLFTTDPSIPDRRLVILADSRGLQPAENVTPLLHRSIVGRYGPRLVRTLDAVSADLGTGTLRRLVALVTIGRQSPRGVADEWLQARGLVPAGRGVG
ncbi:MAG: ABC transporter substrate-binding protein [Nocardioidaceae bacterium]